MTDDSKPRNFKDLPHFFANHYNQILTIIAKWTEKGELRKILSVGQDNTGVEATKPSDVLLVLLREVAGNFPTCPMLKEDYVRDNINPR